MRVENFAYKLKIVPKKSGCYIYYNIQKEIIYVGKSKNLHNRVNSYFNGEKDLKTTLLVKEIYDFEYIITNNELESLLLELNLIKKHLPRYNIRLKDDSAYPFIELTEEKYPRLFTTYQPKNPTSTYYGPYPNSGSASNVVKLLNSIYPLRKCHVLPKKSCIYYQMNQCLAPCIKEIPAGTYPHIVKEIKSFLKGDNSKAIKDLETKMYQASEDLQFELANEYKKMISSIKKINQKQLINAKNTEDMDFFSYDTLEDKICVVTMYMRNGKIVAQDYKINDLNDDPYEMYQSFVLQYYYTITALPKEIVLLKEIPDLQNIVKKKITVPIKGAKKKLVLLAKENAKDKLKENKLLYQRKLDTTINANNELRDLLKMDELHTIEMFDNSNISGKYAVSAMVRYVDGVKEPKSYRKYNVKTVTGVDDYATMQEVVYRRYYRLMMEDAKLPDMIICDGGVGHVSSVKEVIDKLNLPIKVIGLKKNNKHKTEAIINSNLEEIPLKKSSNLYHLLDNIQEEVHRFAITFHRQKRAYDSTKSILDEVPGIGKSRKSILMKAFASIEEMQHASIEDFQKLGIPEKVAYNILNKIQRVSKNDN